MGKIAFLAGIQMQLKRKILLINFVKRKAKFRSVSRITIKVLEKCILSTVYGSSFYLCQKRNLLLKVYINLYGSNCRTVELGLLVE